MERWNKGYDEAHDLFDAEKYADAVKLLENWLSGESCPHVFRVKYMVLLACCLEDWTDKYANLDRADNICANMRRHNAVGNEAIDETLADLRLDIDTTRRLFDREFAKVADDSDDVADTDPEFETEEESDTDECLANAREGKAKVVAAASSPPLRADKVVLDRAVWELWKADRAELEAWRARAAEMEAKKADKSELDALKAELAELRTLVKQQQHGE
jgi:hypothetical protein